MKSDALWDAFIETGAPEFYLLYSQAKRMETTYVYNDQGSGNSGNCLQ